MEKAGFFPRFIAYVIDIVILMVVYVVLSLVLAAVLGDSGASIASLLLAIISIVYIVYFWISTGQTPGKKIMGLKVVATDGSKLTVVKAITRLVGYAISGAILYLGFLWIFIDKDKQGWHDKIASTYVVKA
jgi:uncharacterized RDD family membrane protein YckC